MIKKYLDDLESRIDAQVEDDLYAQWRDFVDGRCQAGIFSPRRSRAVPARVEWPAVSVNRALDDFDTMILHQFGECSRVLAEGSGDLMCVRANYGTSILASLFGAELFMMDEELNTLPTSRPLPGGVAAMQKLVERGVPDVDNALGARTLEMGRRFVAVMTDYPKISKYVHVYHPDLQGPMDICEVLWGSAIFLDIVDMPGLVKSLLAVITEAYTRLMREWDAVVKPEGPCAVHWGMLHKGHIMLRDDSAMNLSPAMFDEFIKPFDQRLMDTFGGGAVHFCGRGDHFIESLATTRGLTAVQMSQTELNNMETVYRSTVDRGLKLLGLPRDAAEAALASGRPLHGNVHCP